MNFREYLDYVGDEWAQAWIERGIVERVGIFVPLPFMHICAQATDAMLLAQVMYWADVNPKTFTPRMSHQRGGHLWTVKTHQEWADECGFKRERTASECLRRLAKQQFIYLEHHKSSFHEMRVVSFVRPHWQQLKTAIRATLAAEPTKNVVSEDTIFVHSENTENGGSEPTRDGRSEHPKSERPSYTETTPKNTKAKTNQRKGGGSRYGSHPKPKVSPASNEGWAEYAEQNGLDH